MTNKTITVKDIDQKIFLKFKAEATRKGLTMGKAVTKALLSWLFCKRNKRSCIEN